MTLSIRSPDDEERPAVLDVVRAAFSAGGHDAAEEVDIVSTTWSCGAAVAGLELVAADDAGLVGHVLAARGDLSGRDVIGVAPLGVVPARQGQGVGTALMTELLRRIEAAGWPAVVLLGSPAYYGRFGFVPAGPLGIVYEPVGPEDPHFQVRVLATEGPALRGPYRYCWEVDRSSTRGGPES